MLERRGESGGASALGDVGGRPGLGAADTGAASEVVCRACSRSLVPAAGDPRTGVAGTVPGTIPGISCKLTVVTLDLMWSACLFHI